MKNINLIKTFTLFLFITLLSVSFTFAQEAAVKKVKQEVKKACCSTDSKTAKIKHKCTEECKTLGCDAVKAKEAKATMKKHVCTEECKTLGCDAVKAKEAKAISHVCTEECKTIGCDAVKAKEAKAKHSCNDDCKDGCTAKS